MEEGESYKDRIASLRSKLSALDEKFNVQDNAPLPASACKQITLELKDIINQAKEVQGDIGNDSRKAEDVNKGLDFEVNSCRKRLTHLKGELEKIEAHIEEKQGMHSSKSSYLATIKDKRHQLNRDLEGLDDKENDLRDQLRSEKQRLNQAELSNEEVQRNFQALQYRYERAKSKRVAAEERLSRAEQVVDGADHAVSNISSQTDENNTKAEDKEVSRVSLAQQLDVKDRKLEELLRRKKFLNHQIETVQEKITAVKGKLNEVHAHLC